MNPAIPAMLFTQLVWGIGPVFVRELATSIGPADSLIIRYGLVSVIYLPLLMASRRWRIARADWPALLFAGFVGMFGYNLGSTFGFEHVGAGLGGLIIGSEPLIIAVMAALLAREPLGRATLAGLLVAFAGTALIFWPDMQAGNAGTLAGALMIFTAGVAWGFYVIAARPLITRYGTFSITAWSIILATLPMLALADPDTPGVMAALSPRQWGAMLYLTVLSTFIASLTWNYASARLSAAVAGAFLYLVPVFSVLGGALILGEEITPEIMLGGTLVLAGVAIAQMQPALKKAPAE